MEGTLWSWSVKSFSCWNFWLHHQFNVYLFLKCLDLFQSLSREIKGKRFFLLAVMSLSLPNKFVLAQEKYPLCHICYFLTKKEGFKLLFPARQTLPLDQETSAIIPHLFFFFEKKRWHDDLQQAPSWFYKLLKKEIKHQDAMNFVQYKNCVWICWIKLF